MNMVINQFDNTNQASEQRYLHLFKNLPICIFVADLTMSPVIIVEVNQRAELVYGYPAAELIGKSATQLMPEESRAFIQEILQRVRRGETVTTETTNLHRDGTTFAVRVIATLDPTDSGRMITTVEDITAEIQRRSETEAIEAERLRIAHEIHDGVAQSLGALRFKSALWSRMTETAPPGMRAAIDELQSVLITTIDDLRRAIFALRPIDLESLGFLPALTQFVTNFGDQNHLSIQLDISPQNTLPTSYELPLFRIIQESLSNVNQHAGASSVLVHLSVDEAGGVVLSVRDNGHGFDPGLARTGDHFRHFGLRHIRERILVRRGTLDIRSAFGKGTELLVTLPPLEVKDAAS